MNDSVLFSHVMEEHGNLEKQKEQKEQDAEEKVDDAAKEKGVKKVGLIQAEERLTGSVAGAVYSNYFRFSGGLIRVPIIMVLLAGYQGSQGL